VLPSSLLGRPLSSLLSNGNANMSALNIEFDIPVATYAVPHSNALLRIWGLSLTDLGSANNLTADLDNPVNIEVSAGFSKGLPLANPQQQGLILRGAIYQAFGNWIGTEQTLDILFRPASGTPNDPINFSFQWPAGTPLKDAIQQVLGIAFPVQKIVVNISPSLVLGYTETGYYQSAQQFADYINTISKAIIGGTSYIGVHISTDGDTVQVWDGTVVPTASAAIQISPSDLVGQPTWIDPNIIMVKLQLRGDLAINDLIYLPPTLVTTTSGALIRFQDKTSFSGNFLITEMQHYGNFRQPDAMSWNTTIWASKSPNG